MRDGNCAVSTGIPVPVDLRGPARPGRRQSQVMPKEDLSVSLNLMVRTRIGIVLNVSSPSRVLYRDNHKSRSSTLTPNALWPKVKVARAIDGMGRPDHGR